MFSFLSFTGNSLMRPVRNASQDSCSGQTIHLGEVGVH